MRVGTLAWARATDGRLSPRDRVELLGQGVTGQLPEIAGLWAGRLGLRPARPVRIDLDSIRVPDSAAAREAERVCAAMRPELLVGHSHRTYLWAAILAAHEGLAYDEEVLYVSSLLHDLGLSAGADGQGRPACFTLVGARACQDLAARTALSDRDAARAAGAVTLHMNLRVGPEDGIEAHLVTVATQLDVIGLRYWRVHPATRRAVLARHPRHGDKAGMADLFRAESRRASGSRARFNWYLGLPLLLRTAPFDE
jgi:hypothetical protein